jgi:hypothetical protein
MLNRVNGVIHYNQRSIHVQGLLHVKSQPVLLARQSSCLNQRHKSARCPIKERAVRSSAPCDMPDVQLVHR